MALVMAMGFLGGLILNLMPCVLPVIGLKILSFLEQSGHSRRHALVLNVWYSLGLLAVFLVLATLAVTLGLGWGQLFSYNGFNITLVAVVFAMGLSFLGVWEIPIPGFVGRGKAVELAEKEGFAGAFVKGAITTILATPCTAPFLAPALTWAASQPPPETYAVFTAVGLGMASPYLVIGAFPGLLSFLPKPGGVDGHLQADHGLRALGHGRLSADVAHRGRWWFRPSDFSSAVGRLLVDRPQPPAVRCGHNGTGLDGGSGFYRRASGLLRFVWLADVMRYRFDRSVEEAIAARMVDIKGSGAVEVVVGPTVKAARARRTSSACRGSPSPAKCWTTPSPRAPRCWSISLPIGA